MTEDLGKKTAVDEQVDEEAAMAAPMPARSPGQDPAEDPKLTREEVWKVQALMLGIVGVAASMVNSPLGHSRNYPNARLTPASFLLIFIALTIGMAWILHSMVIEPSISTVIKLITTVWVFVTMALILKLFSVYIG